MSIDLHIAPTHLRKAAYVILSTLWILLSGVVSARAQEPGARCAAQTSGCFVLTALTIDGVTAYPQRDLAPLYANYLAREIGPEDLVRIAQAITDKYRSDGYFLSRAVVPPQGEARGQAAIQVYEGYVGEVQVTGDAAPALESLLGGLTENRPLKLSDLERRLTLATDLPGVRARTRIEPSLEDPARHKLVVTAGLQRWSASIYADNRGTRAIGPVQSNARLAINSVARAGDQLALSVLTIPDRPSEFTQAELSYGAALAGGARVRAAVSASQGDEGLSPLNNSVGSRSQAGSLRLAIPLQRQRRQSLWGSVSFDARHVEQVYANGAGYADDLRVVRAGLQADRATGASSTSGYLQLSRGIDALGATARPGPATSRYGADGGFWKLDAGASHYNDLGRMAGLFVSADGQWAPEPLLLSEAFAAGGLPYGRAYSYAEITGDSGLAAQVELRVGGDPKLKPLSFIQGYGFVDAAKVWNHPSPYGVRSADLASAGGGLRLSFGPKANLRLEAAKPLSRVPFEKSDRGWRFFVGLWAGF